MSDMFQTNEILKGLCMTIREVDTTLTKVVTALETVGEVLEAIEDNLNNIDVNITAIMCKVCKEKTDGA